MTETRGLESTKAEDQADLSLEDEAARLQPVSGDAEAATLVATPELRHAEPVGDDETTGCSSPSTLPSP